MAGRSLGEGCGMVLAEIESVLVDEARVQVGVAELAGRISEDYRGRDLLLVGVLKGAVVFMADLSRALTIPHEVDWLRTAVHLQKGCYRGQETIARVHNLGRPPRRLVFLHLDGSEHTLPSHGDPVHGGERQVGFVTTAARHHELGPIALALVKRNTPDGVPLAADGVAASVAPDNVAV